MSYTNDFKTTKFLVVKFISYRGVNFEEHLKEVLAISSKDKFLSEFFLILFLLVMQIYT